MSIIMGPPMSIIGGPRSMNPFLSKGGKGPGGPLGPKPPATGGAPIHSDALSSRQDGPSLLSLLDG